MTAAVLLAWLTGSAGAAEIPNHCRVDLKPKRPVLRGYGRPGKRDWELNSHERSYSFDGGRVAGRVTDGVFSLVFYDATPRAKRSKSGVPYVVIHARTARGARDGSDKRAADPLLIQHDPKAVSDPDFINISPLSPLEIHKCQAPSLAESEADRTPESPDPSATPRREAVSVMGVARPLYQTGQGKGWLYYYDPGAAEAKPFVFYKIGYVSGRSSAAIQKKALDEFLAAARFPRTPATRAPRPQTEFFAIPLSGSGGER